MKAYVRDGCISCGLCVATCPEVFRFNDEGVSEVYSEVAPIFEEKVKEAAQGCPVSVIEI